MSCALLSLFQVLVPFFFVHLHSPGRKGGRFPIFRHGQNGKAAQNKHSMRFAVSSDRVRAIHNSLCVSRCSPPMLADRQRLECTMMQPVGHHNLHPRRCWCPEWTGNYTQYQLLLRSSFCLESLQPVSWCAPVWNMGPSVPLRGSSALYSVLQHRALAVTCCVSEEESLIFLCQLIAGQFQCS